MIKKKKNFLCVNAQGSENFSVLSLETAISSQSISYTTRN